MKTIWKVLSVMAIANLLALVGFGVWLKTSDRVDMERVRAIREVFTETVTDQKLREEQEEEDRIEQVRLAAEAAAESVKGEPISADTQERMQGELEALATEKLQRMEHDMTVLKRMLAEERRRLDADIFAFRAERDVFSAERERITKIEGDGQFKKAVKAFEKIDSKSAVDMLTQIMAGPTIDGADGMGQVVSYLNAMGEGPRREIIEEFADGDPAMAADLLERLRTYGLLAQAPEEPGG